MKNTENNQNDILDSLYEVQKAIESLNEGDFYGDKMVDSLGCIATSLRVLSGRSKWKNGKEVNERTKESKSPWYTGLVLKFVVRSYNRQMKDFDSLPEDEQVIFTLEKAWFELCLEINQNRDRIEVDGSFYFQTKKKFSPLVDTTKKYFDTHEASPKVLKRWYRLFKDIKEIF
jgi:hypothetical protein